MNYNEKVLWLRRYQECLRQEKELAEEVERLRSKATRVTPLLTGMPGGQGEEQKLPKAVEAIIKAQSDLQEQILRCEEIRREVVSVIESIPNTRDREIIRRRYVLGQRWEKISEAMGMDERWIRRKHQSIVVCL